MLSKVEPEAPSAGRGDSAKAVKLVCDVELIQHFQTSSKLVIAIGAVFCRDQFACVYVWKPGFLEDGSSWYRSISGSALLSRPDLFRVWM